MKNSVFGLITIISLIIGSLFGMIFPGFMNSISFIGDIYINLLKFLIAPILITTIITTVYKSANKKLVLLGKTILTFILMFIVSFIITSVIMFVLKPGVNFSFSEVVWNGEITELSLSKFLVNIFPTNIIDMISSNSVLSCIIFAFAFGLIATKVKDSKKVISLIEILKNIFNKFLEYIMYLTPIAVFSIMGSVTAKYGINILGNVGKYLLVAYIACLIVTFLVMILPVWLIAKINPITYIKKVYTIWILTVSTCSSAATLPTTIKICNEEFGISNRITDIVVPLGCTIHMCGGAVSFAILGIFSFQMFGVNITLGKYLLMLVSATLINMAAPGIPGGGIVLGASYLSILGSPLTFIGVYSGFYRLLDMAYTSLNVTGDITANILINETEKND